MSSTNDSGRGTVVLSDIRKISQRGKKKAQDDSKKLETLKRSSFRGTKSGIVVSTIKRQLSSRGLREQEVLREARRLVENDHWLSEVMEVVDVKGQKVMWLTVPQELKDKYNCTDMKCYDQWLKRVRMDINAFKPGMKLRMKVTSVSVRGKFGNQPIVRGIPCSAKSPRNNQEWFRSHANTSDVTRQSMPQSILVGGRPKLSPRKAASPILNGPSPRFMQFLRQREGPGGRGSYQEHLGYVKNARKQNRLSRPSTGSPHPHQIGFRRSHHDFRIAHSPRNKVSERFSRNTKSGIQLSRFSCTSPLNAQRRNQKARGH